MPRKSTLRIISIVQARVDAFLKEIFDLCESYEDSTAKGLSDTIATEIAIYDTLETVIRRRRNERTLFSRLATDIVHSIFGIALDVDRIHDPDLPSNVLKDYGDQLERMRRVSSAWNNFLLSSPRYWQVIDITRPAKAITSVIERSRSAPLCVYSFVGTSRKSSIRLVPAARVQTLRSDDAVAYHLYRQFLQNPMPALQALEIRALPWMGDDPSEPLGNLPSIRHLKAQWWQPPADAAWLTGLKELVLWRTSEPNMELLQVLSACANLEQLSILSTDEFVVGELPDAISPIALPRLRSIYLTFKSNASVAKLIRRLIAPQCFRRTLYVEQVLNFGLHIADYGRFISLEEGCSDQYPNSAYALIRGSYPGLKYKTESRQVVLDKVPSVEDVPAFYDLVQEFQSVLKRPSLTVIINYPSEATWLLLKSLGDQNIHTIVARLTNNSSDTGDFLKAIKAHPADLPGLDGPVTNATTDWSFKSLRVIEIHNTYVDLDDFTGLVEEYLHKNCKPLLEEIILVNCTLEGLESNHAVERLEKIGIALRLVFAGEAEESLSGYSGTS
ncbi:hypothetical protein M407DRAFT_31701 [Tulasnella calospora MUT 4182]|uniref:F-box domain-containing protein n=1 Tax=Tulasnella calospora MUT 4182 TaxID=1051891 RepID=A0A0C3KB49_9AGAM|nr:hypothetical protein M407DRAFT_31701 [Tulasnella calospora MUT 4182]